MSALRWILGAVGIVVVLVVLAIAAVGVWLNSYIQSDAFRVEIQNRASASLGGPVQIQKVDFRILSGVTLQGVATQVDPSHSGGRGRLDAQIATVSCTYAWTELLTGKLKITGLTLDQPQIVLTKGASETQPTPQPEATTQTSSAAPSEATTASGKSVPFQFVLERARIKDGFATIQNPGSAPLCQLKGINVNADTSGFNEGQDVTGSFSIEDIGFLGNMHATGFNARFTYAPSSGAVTVKPFAALAYGGHLAGYYLPQSNGITSLTFNSAGIDLAQLAAATSSDSSAKLTGTLGFNSKWSGIESGDLNGEGDATITDGKLEGVKILEEIGSVLKIKELNEPVITKAVTHFVAQGGNTQLTGLRIDSTVFSITGGGNAGANGQINFDLVLVLTRGAMEKLPSAVAASFVKQVDGTGTVAFKVSGTASNPQTDLPQRLLMQNTQIQNVLNKALNKLFH